MVGGGVLRASVGRGGRGAPRGSSEARQEVRGAGALGWGQHKAVGPAQLGSTGLGHEASGKAPPSFREEVGSERFPTPQTASKVQEPPTLAPSVHPPPLLTKWERARLRGLDSGGSWLPSWCSHLEEEAMEDERDPQPALRSSAHSQPRRESPDSGVGESAGACRVPPTHPWLPYNWACPITAPHPHLGMSYSCPTPGHVPLLPHTWA